MIDKPTPYTIRIITFGVPDTNNDVIMRTAINENDLISLAEKKEILAYKLTDDYLDVSVDAGRFSANVVIPEILKDINSKESGIISLQSLFRYKPPLDVFTVTLVQ